MPEKLLEKLISYKMEALNYSYIYLLALNGLFRFDRSRERLKIKAFGKFFCFGSKWSHFLYPENHSLGEWFKRGCCR